MTFECRPDCGECCFIVPFDGELWERIRGQALRPVLEEVRLPLHQVLPVTSSLKCCFLQEDKKCAIYEDRPPVCQYYGRRRNPCPYIKPDGQPRTPRGVALMKNRIPFPNESNVTIRTDISHFYGIEFDPGAEMILEVRFKFHRGKL
jgi:hypothetical protein